MIALLIRVFLIVGSFITLNVSTILACKPSVESKLMVLWIFPCTLLVSFLLLLLRISLIFVILIIMCLGGDFFRLILFGTQCFLDLDVCFLSEVRKVFSYYFFK